MILKAGERMMLDYEDQETITLMAEELCKQERENFNNDLRVDHDTKLFKMLRNGFGAELAFCRMVGVEFDNSTDKNKNYYAQSDGHLPDGSRFDVKSTIYATGKLLLKKGYERVYVDKYVLMTGQFPTFSFAGYALYKELVDDSRLVQYPRSLSYTLQQHELKNELLVGAES